MAQFYNFIIIKFCHLVEYSINGKDGLALIGLEQYLSHKFQFPIRRIQRIYVA